LVLQGIDFNEFRPRVLVIEATEPNSTEAAYHRWEARVLNSGYLFAFFDGLNRYYVDQKYKDLISDIAIPANILDNYKTNVQIEIEKELESYMNQFNNSITYTNSLLTENEKTTQYVNSLVQEIEKCRLAIADQQQRIIDVEDRISILKASNRAMEDKIVELSSATNKLKRILSSVAIRILRKLKRILRKLLGR
jgi:chromosome segregation ATPase